jgi:acyl-CoA synthetase (AMP-forming)/AMP-acid ligase II
MATLAELLTKGSSSHPALVVPEGPTVTYEGLGTQIEELASALKGAGVESGQAVSIVLGNNIEFVAAFLAVTRLGATAAPLNPSYTTDEYRFYMEDASAVMAILPPGEHPAREAAQNLGLPQVEASATNEGKVELRRDGALLTGGELPAMPNLDDTALFLHTSGTTSRPKGVPLTHANLTSSLANIVDTYDLTSEDVAMLVMPLFHVHGLIGVLLSTLASGGTSVLPSRFSASTFWPVVEKYGANWYSAVPTIHQILLTRADGDDAPRGTFRLIRSCSAALAPAVLDQLEARFDAPVLEAYGMTEASHQMSSNPLPPRDRKAGTVGEGTGVQIGIMDEAGKLLQAGQRGEVVIKGSNVMHGYRNNPEANSTAFADGWFRTGDQGFKDGNDYLTLTGRLKELINRGGEKISPLEVDAVLAQIPALAEAISFGVPDAKYGEEVHAAVVLNGEATQEEIRAFCQQHLIDFKVPKVIHFMDELPRTATGKIQRRNIAAQLAEASEPSASS